MFKWNVEEMKLTKERENAIFPNKHIWSCEHEVSREDKIKFVDEQTDGKLSIILNLHEKFQKEKAELPKDRYGEVKTTSLIAWVKRNQALRLIDITYNYGQIYLFPFLERNIQCLNIKGQFDCFSDYIDEVFHRQLLQCEKKERQWFLEHDEYSILKTKLRKAMEKHSTTFEVNIGYSSSGEVFVYDDCHNTNRPITIEEIKTLLTQYEKLDNYTHQLSKEIEIIF
jgi:hypothetical protein